MIAQNGPKMAQIGAKCLKNGDLKVPVVKNCENSLERKWNKIGEVQANVFGPIWSSKVACNGQNWPKIPKNGNFKFQWSETVGRQ